MLCLQSMIYIRLLRRRELCLVTHLLIMPLVADLKLCFDTDHLLCQKYSTSPCTHCTLLRQEELLREFHDVCEYLALTAYHIPHFSQRHAFPVHFPIPHHHADAYPHVVCFWRALQKHTALGGLWSNWCSNNCIFSWSQVQPSTIKLFFSDVQALCLQMLASTTTSISISDTLWETLETVFGCTDIILGSVWSTGSCRD